MHDFGHLTEPLSLSFSYVRKGANYRIYVKGATKIQWDDAWEVLSMRSRTC